MSGELLYLSRADVERVALPPAEIIEAVTTALVEKGKGRAEMPPKPGIHTAPDGFLHAMPAYLPSIQAAGLKWVGGNPENTKRGVPYITGLLILNDPATSLPLTVMDATWITAMRTAAATAVAARHLARRDSRTLALLGCGVQGRSHAVVVPEEMASLDRIIAYDIQEENGRRFQKEMSLRIPIEIELAPSAEHAVRAADVIVTAGPILKQPKPILALEWLSPGDFVCTLDFDSYVRPETFQGVDKLACDDTPQFRYYRDIGFFQQVPEPYADLGELATGEKAGREANAEVTLCANLGLAVEDMAVAQRLYNKALQEGVGTSLPL
jgi:ornithine cyclodeaminase/alanine dehydrogenase